MANNKKKQDKYERKNSKTPRASLNLSSETKRGIVAVVFLVLALISAMSAFGFAGALGNFWFHFLQILFGILAYLFPLFLVLFSLVMLKVTPRLNSGEPDQSFFSRTYFGALCLVIGISGLIHIFFISPESGSLAVASSGRGSGYFGALFAGPLYGLLGLWAGAIILLALTIIGSLVILDISLHSLLPFLFKKKIAVPAEAVSLSNADIKIKSMSDADLFAERLSAKTSQVNNINTSNLQDSQENKQKLKAEANVAKLEAIVLDERKDWKLPPFDLLEEGKDTVDSGNIEARMAIIQKTLKDFGIEAEMGEVSVGPTVTQYTLRPPQGVKLTQIAALQDNLALELAANPIRLELPIPGKSLVGVEVPNKSVSVVRLRDVLKTSEFVNYKGKLAMALGRDVAGKALVIDMEKMPHLLIAGTTGSGKSVGIHSLIISLLYRNTPQDVKFIIIDPKRVEMNLYDGIPHLLTPVVVDHDKAVNSLKWAVGEMDRRYKVMSEAKKRNISEYNESSPVPFHFIIVIVDELADLMAVAKADVEASIVRLSQMARAVGIHLVLATQYPKTEVLTGLIKANISARIAFAVPTNMNSRVVLDHSGAEKLVGKGDMLFLSSESNKPRRVQGAYVDEKEIKRVVDFFKQQAGAVIYNEEIVEKPKRALGIPGMESTGDDDVLLEAAKEEVMQAGKASASFLQRRLKVGYARAARLLDLLEEQGVIGPGEGAKPREVFGAIPKDEKEEYGIEEDTSSYS